MSRKSGHRFSGKGTRKIPHQGRENNPVAREKVRGREARKIAAYVGKSWNSVGTMRAAKSLNTRTARGMFRLPR
jgi:hypothetical protein